MKPWDNIQAWAEIWHGLQVCFHLLYAFRNIWAYAFGLIGERLVLVSFVLSDDFVSDEQVARAYCEGRHCPSAQGEG